MKKILAGLAALSMFGAAHANVVYDESVSGDLSSDPLAPTPVAFGVGDNFVNGSVTASTGDIRDYITFTIAAGTVLDAIILVSYLDGDDPSTPVNTGFYAVTAGSQSVIPGGSTIGSLLNGNTINSANVGLDLLESSTAGIGAPGSLVPGVYSFVTQQTGPQVNDYSFNFVVSQADPVPLPAAGLLFGAGAALFGLRRHFAKA